MSPSVKAVWPCRPFQYIYMHILALWKLTAWPGLWSQMISVQSQGPPFYSVCRSASCFHSLCSGSSSRLKGSHSSYHIGASWEFNEKTHARHTMGTMTASWQKNQWLSSDLQFLWVLFMKKSLLVQWQSKLCSGNLNSLPGQLCFMLIEVLRGSSHCFWSDSLLEKLTAMQKVWTWSGLEGERGVTPRAKAEGSVAMVTRSWSQL